MQLEAEVIEAQVLRLSPEDRVRLLDRLILSRDADQARDQAWDVLAAQRDAEIESGQIDELDGPQALAQLRANPSSGHRTRHRRGLSSIQQERKRQSCRAVC